MTVDLLTLLAAVSIPTLGMAAVGVLWLSAERRASRYETERDHYWDMCIDAGLLTAQPETETSESSNAEEPGVDQGLVE